jgi:hypothetical protein
MSNKYLEKIAGFKGQSLGHLEGKYKALSTAIDNHYYGLGNSYGLHDLKRKARNLVSKGSTASVSNSTKLNRAEDRLKRVGSEIHGRRISNSPLAQLLDFIAKPISKK